MDVAVAAAIPVSMFQNLSICDRKGACDADERERGCAGNGTGICGTSTKRGPNNRDWSSFEVAIKEAASKNGLDIKGVHRRDEVEEDDGRGWLGSHPSSAKVLGKGPNVSSVGVGVGVYNQTSTQHPQKSERDIDLGSLSLSLDAAGEGCQSNGNGSEFVCCPQALGLESSVRWSNGGSIEWRDGGGGIGGLGFKFDLPFLKMRLDEIYSSSGREGGMRRVEF